MLKPHEPAPSFSFRRSEPPPPTQELKGTTAMTSTDLERWSRVKLRLRAEVGDDIFSSWFARMDLDGIDEGAVRLTVPTRFLKSWIQAHYAERLLACWKAEQALVRRVDIGVRSAVLRNICTKAQPELATEPTRENRNCAMERTDERVSAAPAAIQHEALGGSPLDPRLTT